MKKPLLLLIFITFIAIGGYQYFQNKFSISKKLRNPKQNVVFILIDTLRADYLNTYGFKIKTAPFIDSLANNGIVFTKAIAPSSWTAPSVASLFTSSYPSEHGVKTGLVVRKKLSSLHQDAKFNRISSAQQTMPEYFQSSGYITFGIADNQNIGSSLGFDQGFDELFTFHDESAEVVNKKAQELLDSVDKTKSLFLYLHYMDPHAPYTAHAPWYKRSPDRREDARRRYISEISYLDSKIKSLFDKNPHLKDSIIIITADHGEQFWEHGLRGHGKTLHREEIHIPLIIYHPKIDKKITVDRPVSLIDLLPTLADLTAGEINPDWHGSSLTSVMDGDDPKRSGAFSELIFNLLQKRAKPMRSLVKDDQHIIKHLKNPPKVFVYDWAANKRETKVFPLPLDSKEAKTIQAFEDLLKPSFQETTVIKFSEKEIEKLKSLGYVQ